MSIKEFFVNNKYVYSISESTEKILRNGQTRYILWSEDFIAHEDNNVQLNDEFWHRLPEKTSDNFK